MQELEEVTSDNRAKLIDIECNETMKELLIDNYYAKYFFNYPIAFPVIF